MVLFTELPISPYLQSRLAAAEFINPTEVQAAAIPHVLQGRDVLAAAQRWADDELRSLNAQIEYVLRDALRKAGRLPNAAKNEGKEPKK